MRSLSSLRSAPRFCHWLSDFRLGRAVLIRGLTVFCQSVLAVVVLLAVPAGSMAAPKEPGPVAKADLRELARQNLGIHRFSTLFTAQNVRQYLSNDTTLEAAIDWCHQTAVSKVYIESFRDGYQAERATLEKARDTFRQAGFEVSGCVTTTRVGKPSTGWKNEISCYTDKPTQQKLKDIFSDAASLFDEIMIDDFWFTDCACGECDAARQARKVVIGNTSYSVTGDTWEDYRCELMVRLSRDCVLAPARQANPKARLIIKYPQWYDRFHERGYEVVRETADFDRIWVGTETRDFNDQRWGGTVPYEAFFIMRWLGGIGGLKCGGGWYDWLGTTEHTYLEQARQTVLGGARESFLFCYGGLQGSTGPKNIAALRTNLAELFAVAREAKSRQLVGVAAYKPANSHPEAEQRVFDFVGMLGVPLAPGHEFPTNAPAAFFSVHALKDAAFAGKLAAFIRAGKPVLLTDGLAARLAGQADLAAPNVQTLSVRGNPKSLLDLSQTQVDELRAPLLRPLKTVFRAPNRVGLYLFQDGSWVVENFNDEPARVEVNGQPHEVPARGWSYQWK
jgi:hypothetical protein